MRPYRSKFIRIQYSSLSWSYQENIPSSGNIQGLAGIHSAWDTCPSQGTGTLSNHLGSYFRKDAHMEIGRTCKTMSKHEPEIRIQVVITDLVPVAPNMIIMFHRQYHRGKKNASIAKVYTCVQTPWDPVTSLWR